MQVSNKVNSGYHTSYQSNTSVKYCAGFTQTEEGGFIPNETSENPGFAEFVDYQEFHKAWMSQGADTAFSYTANHGFNAKENSISLVPGMSVRLKNGFRLAITDYMVQALGDFRDNAAAGESAAIAGALSHLIKVANGQIPMNMFYSKNQDNSAYAKIGLQAFGIDTSRAFTINGKTFHFDSDGQIRLGSGQDNKTNVQADTSQETRDKKESRPVAKDAIEDHEGAVTIAECEDKGEFLGITMIPEEGQSVTYGMRAMLSDKSTPTNPIVQVISNLGGKKVIYNVDISKVDPNNATQLEMFALLSYADKMGLTDGGTFGSFQQLKVYGENASRNRYCGSLSGGTAFLNEKFDWSDIIERMMNDYYEAEIYNQYEDCKKLIDFFETITDEEQDYQKLLEEHMKELLEKIKNGDTETSFQIGAQSFTEKEWKEFLEGFDSMEDAIKELMRERHEKAEEAKEQQEIIEQAERSEVNNMLFSESTTCTYPTEDPTDNDIHYITWYTEEGIFCRKAGQTEGYEWSITFENKEQYEKVMELIGQFPSDWNMRFAAHENFWTDFLNNKIDMDAFMEFMEGTNKGVPDYSLTIGDSMYIDKEKMQWAKYFNPLGDRFYTAEEFMQLQREIVEANAANKVKVDYATGQTVIPNRREGR